MFGLFNIGRTPLKNFKKNEAVFQHFLKKDEELGTKHFLQAITLFFIRRFPDLQKEAPSLMQYMVTQKYLSKDFLLAWNSKKQKLDKSCMLYDKKAEKKFKAVLVKFMEWLEEMESSSDDDSSSGEEEAKGEETKKQETDLERKKREQMELIRQQQEEQAKAMQDKKEKAEQEETKKQQHESKQDQTKVDVTKIAVEDDFDVDDI